MKKKYVFLSLLLFSFVISCFLIIFKNNNQPKLLILPFDYYTENDSTLIDLVNFKYLLSNDACSKNATYIQIVTSYAGNVDARSALRRAYSAAELEPLGVARIFLLAALPPTHSIRQNALLSENSRYQDLLQGNFFESYRNLTYKHIMGLKWVVDNCHTIKYIIKSDDDIIINMYKLINYIETYPHFEMMGYLLNNMKPIRLKANKWYVTKEEFSGDNYPNFLSGWMYVVKKSVAKNILRNVQNFKYFWIDDLFVTGILAEKANVTLKDVRELFSLHPEVVECCLRKGLECGFLAAPSSGDYSLHLKFQIHSRNCYLQKCPKLPSGQKIEDKCVAQGKIMPRFNNGTSIITIIH